MPWHRYERMIISQDVLNEYANILAFNENVSDV